MSNRDPTLEPTWDSLTRIEEFISTPVQFGCILTVLTWKYIRLELMKVVAEDLRIFTVPWSHVNAHRNNQFLRNLSFWNNTDRKKLVKIVRNSRNRSPCTFNWRCTKDGAIVHLVTEYVVTPGLPVRTGLSRHRTGAFHLGSQIVEVPTM
ncbi:hypothetical protein M7I_0509 [Glarea lozoyensis 74030]|uniref:Uncharacterized protein n=1 Tax=Glarea lozoyensis (strain ATCC 74030 / MF5533) TaxID=1104152 RepID=H0EDQ4_GLAL7|nr:hypothetical protein M7I_0509 [Glarea lozoyensis 74030]